MEQQPTSDKHRLANAALAGTEGPATVLEVLEACGGNYALASAEVYRRIGTLIAANTIRNWHDAAQATPA